MGIDLKVGSEPVAGYRLVSPLGRGGFGEVWRAIGPGDFGVALKFVPLAEEVGASELRSLDVIRGIRHSHLLATFGAWQIDTFLIVAMELAERTLFDRFRECVASGGTGIPEPEIFDHFLDAARGIDFLNESRHSLGGKEAQAIQHRDIKPQNLLLVGGSVKVADYGLARVLQNSQTAHTGSMTPAYAPPEFFHRQTSSRSDQYSLAVSYCHLRGGRLPFAGSFAEMMTGHLTQPPDLTMLPPAERLSVGRALAKDPLDRWPSCRAFIESLRTGTLVETLEALSGSETLRAFPGLEPQGETTRPMTHPPVDVPPTDGRIASDADVSTFRGYPDQKTTEPAEPTRPEVPTVADTPPPRPEVPTAADSPPRRKVPAWSLGVLALALGLASFGVYRRAVSPGKDDARLVKSVPRSTLVGSVGKNDEAPREAEKPRETSRPPAQNKPEPPVVRPKLTLSVPGAVDLSPGDEKAVTLEARRADFEGPVAVRFEGLPAGVSAPEATIPAGASGAEVKISASLDVAPGESTVRVVGSGTPGQGEASLKLVVAESARSHERRGKRFAERRQTAAAIGEYDKAIRLGPEVASLYVARAAAYHSIGDNPSALTDLSRANELAPKTPGADTIRGQISSESGKLDTAIGEFGKALELDPNDVVALTERGFAHSKLGKSELAAADLDNAIRVDSKHAPAYVRRALVARAKGDRDRAIADLKVAVALDPDDPHAPANLGILLAEKGDADGAISQLDAAVNNDPRNPAAYNRRGHAYAQNGDSAKALADFNNAIRLDPSYAPAYTNRAKVYEEKGDPDKALSDRDAAGLIEPNSGDLGHPYELKADLDRAISGYDTAIRLDPNLASAYYGRGKVELTRGDLNRALADLDKAFRLGAETVQVWTLRGVATARLGDPARALADFNAALRLDPDYAPAYLNRGKIHLAKGDHDRAVSEFDTVIRLDPRNALAYALRGTAYVRKGEPDRALADFDTAIRLDPGYAEAHQGRGEAFAKKGETGKALADFDAALRLDPSLVAAYEARGALHKALGNSAMADADFRRATRTQTRGGANPRDP